MKFFDSHSHYNDEKFDVDRKEILKDLIENHINGAICAGYNIKSSKKAIELSTENKCMYATCGISPNDIDEAVEKSVKEIEEIAQNNRVVAIGEIGLDYYWNKENKEKQKEFFIRQIEIANKLNLPIVIHTREAVMDTLEILKQNKCNKKGVFHCCPLNIELVKQALKLGYYISFSGNITFKNAKSDEIIKAVPLDKILIETDCPYLSPEPNRGKRNTSANLIYIAKKIAEVKEITVEDVSKITYENCKILFNIM